MKPIAMHCTQEQFDKIKPKLSGLTIKDVGEWKTEMYLSNNYINNLGLVTNLGKMAKSLFGRKVFETWDEDTFLKYCDIKTTKTSTMKTTITAAELLELHSIACSGWKDRFVKYFERLDVYQKVTFNKGEIDAMFLAASSTQLPTLEKIFGKQQEPIDFSKLKTGSVVKIKTTGRQCGGAINLDLSKPVDIVFYTSPHFINVRAEFKKTGSYPDYTTFHQNGKYAFFGGGEVDYITEVISY